MVCYICLVGGRKPYIAKPRASSFSAFTSSESAGRPASPGQGPRAPAPFSSRSTLRCRLATLSGPGQGPRAPAPFSSRSTLRCRLATLSGPGQGPRAPAPFSSRSTLRCRLATLSGPGQGPRLPAWFAARPSCLRRLAASFSSSFCFFSASLQSGLLHQPWPRPLRVPTPHRSQGGMAAGKRYEEINQCKPT